MHPKILWYALWKLHVCAPPLKMYSNILVSRFPSFYSHGFSLRTVSLLMLMLLLLSYCCFCSCFFLALLLFFLLLWRTGQRTVTVTFSPIFSPIFFVSSAHQKVENVTKSQKCCPGHSEKERRRAATKYKYFGTPYCKTKYTKVWNYVTNDKIGLYLKCW